jgi:hypothetical protein
MASGSNGLMLGGGVKGKHRFRIRERHIAEHLIPLMRKRAVGTAKLDLVLRCVAFTPRDAGRRAPGTVLRDYTWENLHDVTRVPGLQGSAPPDLDASPSVRKLKRKWVGEQLARLQAMGLVERDKRPGDRPRLIVLRDDGSGAQYDDPGDSPTNDRYVTLPGQVISTGRLARWGVPELSAFLACMVAERHDRAALTSSAPAGGGQWFRPLGWFADVDRLYGPEARVRQPFSVPTLERGLKRLREEGLVSWTTISVDPQTNRRLKRSRNFYRNRFNTLEDLAT